MTVGYGNRSVVVVVVAVVAVALGGCGGTEASEDSRVGDPVVSVGPKSARLSARSQKISSSSVVVDEASLGAPGYVAVYDDGGGAPGRRVGQSGLLEVGDHRDVTVGIGQVAPSTTRVWVMVHSEDNGNTTLEFPAADGPVAAENGVLVVPVSVLAGSKEGSK